MLSPQIVDNITRFQAHYRGYLVRKLFNRCYQQFCAINDRIIAAINQEWKHQVGESMEWTYNMSLGVDIVEKEGIKYPLFLPLEVFLWKDLPAYKETLEKRKEEENLLMKQRIQQLEDECQSLESYIRQRIETLMRQGDSQLISK